MKLTRPPAPWMSSLDITSLQRQREIRRKAAQQTGTPADWNKYRDTRNQLKKEIKQTKKTFFKKALMLKKSKDVWKTIHRILKPSYNKIKTDPKALNDHFNSLATKVTGKESDEHEYLQSFIKDLPTNNSEASFTLRQTTYNEVNKILKAIRNDTST